MFGVIRFYCKTLARKSGINLLLDKNWLNIQKIGTLCGVRYQVKQNLRILPEIYILYSQL